MIDGIRCNLCNQKMEARIEKPIPIKLAPVSLANGRTQEVTCNYLAYGQETEQVMRPCQDHEGNRLPDAPMTQTVVAPNAFDICLKCQIVYAEMGLEILKETYAKVTDK